MKLSAIGLVETTSIARAYAVEDAVLKTAEVQLLLARTICSGKFIVIVGGELANIKASVAAGAEAAAESLIEERVISRVHPDVFPALGQSVDLDPATVGALGVVETFTASAIIQAADAAVKAAPVTLFRIHVAMAIGGKGFFQVTGDIASVEAAVEAGAALAAEDGVLVASTVIPGPRPELFQEYI